MLRDYFLRKKLKKTDKRNREALKKVHYFKNSCLYCQDLSKGFFPSQDTYELELCGANIWVCEDHIMSLYNEIIDVLEKTTGRDALYDLELYGRTVRLTKTQLCDLFNQIEVLVQIKTILKKVKENRGE